MRTKTIDIIMPSYRIMSGFPKNRASRAAMKDMTMIIILYRLQSYILIVN